MQPKDIKDPIIVAGYSASKLYNLKKSEKYKKYMDFKITPKNNCFNEEVEKQYIKEDLTFLNKSINDISDYNYISLNTEDCKSLSMNKYMSSVASSFLILLFFSIGAISLFGIPFVIIDKNYILPIYVSIGLFVGLSLMILALFSFFMNNKKMKIKYLNKKLSSKLDAKNYSIDYMYENKLNKYIFLIPFYGFYKIISLLNY